MKTFRYYGLELEEDLFTESLMEGKASYASIDSEGKVLVHKTEPTQTITLPNGRSFKFDGSGHVATGHRINLKNKEDWRDSVRKIVFT